MTKSRMKDRRPPKPLDSCPYLKEEREKANKKVVQLCCGVVVCIAIVIGVIYFLDYISNYF